MSQEACNSIFLDPICSSKYLGCWYIYLADMIGQEGGIRKEKFKKAEEKIKWESAVKEAWYETP